MDLSKYPFEKLFYFVAGIIPGFVALLIFQLATPKSFDWFFTIGFLGYKSKITIIAIAAFIIGNSMTSFLGSISGGVVGAIGGYLATEPYKPPHSYEVAPWRDPRWRLALKRYLGEQAPNDSNLITPEVFNLLRGPIERLPVAEQPLALLTLENSSLNSKMDDGKWSNWYNHYHQIVLTQEKPEQFERYVRKGLNFNLETTSFYVVISALIVPAVRHWWCILPAGIWIIIFLSEQYRGVRQFRDPWSTLAEQIDYLIAQKPLQEAETDR
jgi:hypothetical protein